MVPSRPRRTATPECGCEQGHIPDRAGPTAYPGRVEPAAHPGSEHLLTFPDREVAEQVAADLDAEGFSQVRVTRAAASTGRDASAPGWAVFLRDERLPASQGGGAYEGLRERFTALVEEHGGWYDEPGDPRPPAGDLAPGPGKPAASTPPAAGSPEPTA